MSTAAARKLPVARAPEPIRSRVLRPSARPLHAVLHRDVGALQLLRDARAPHPLHDRGARGRRPRLRRRRRPAPSTALYTSMVYMMTLPGGWIADRLIGPQRAVLVGGILIACGHFSMAVPVAVDVLSRPRADRDRHRVCSKATSASSSAVCTAPTTAGATPGSRSSTWGSTSARSSRRSSAAISASAVNWHLGFAAAGVGMMLGLVQYVAGPQAPRRRRPPPGRPGLAAGARPNRNARPRAGSAPVVGALVLFGLGVYTGVIPVTPTQIADAAGYVLLGLSVGFFAWVFLSGGWTRAERNHLLRHRRALRRLRALLRRCSSRPVRR